MSEIDEILETRKEESEDMSRLIRGGIRRNIYSRAVITVLVLALAAAGIWHGARAVKENHSFHLEDMEYLLDDRIPDANEELADNLVTANAGWYLNCYFELFVPGSCFILDPNCAPAEKDFGAWAVTGYLLDAFHMNPEYARLPEVKSDSRREFEIRDGSFVPDADILYSIYYENPFRNWWSFNSTWERWHSVPDIKTEIESLPDSASVEFDLKFKETSDTDGLLLWLSQYPGSTPVYAVTHLYTDKENGYRICPQGFSFLRSFYIGPTSEETREKYPGFSPAAVSMVPYYKTSSFVSAPQRKHVKEELLSHYRDSLKLLLDNDFLNEKEKDIAEYVYGDLLEKEPEILGMRIYCSKEDARKLLEDDNILNIRIADIKLHRFD
ncbi:MAG: hypothetical protein K6G61_08260 [Solobacterium sp.]|nr:hypothetical protein [Solobacterium sp.]